MVANNPNERSFEMTIKILKSNPTRQLSVREDDVSKRVREKERKRMIRLCHGNPHAVSIIPSYETGQKTG